MVTLEELKNKNNIIHVILTTLVFIVILSGIFYYINSRYFEKSCFGFGGSEMLDNSGNTICVFSSSSYCSLESLQANQCKQGSNPITCKNDGYYDNNDNLVYLSSC